MENRTPVIKRHYRRLYRWNSGVGPRDIYLRLYRLNSGVGPRDIYLRLYCWNSAGLFEVDIGYAK